MHTDAKSFLLDLLSAHGVSGAEMDAAAVWRGYAASFAEVDSDAVGNSYAAAGPADGPRVALLGHIDEIGLIVTHIEEGGMLRVRPLGTWDAEVLVGQHVRLRREDGTIVPGVIGKAPPHLAADGSKKASTLQSVWADVGASTREQAEALAAIGDTVILHGGPTELAGGRLASKALDNRLGAWVVLEAVRRAAADSKARLVASACVMEETTMDGGRVAAHTIKPSVSLVVDVTHAADMPGTDAGSVHTIKLGGGPVLTRGLGMHPGLFARIRDTADRLGIAYQVEAQPGTESTFTDVDGALDAHAGSATALVSIALRHMHSPAEVCDLADVDACAQLLAAVCISLSADDRWER